MNFHSEWFAWHWIKKMQFKTSPFKGQDYLGILGFVVQQINK